MRIFILACFLVATLAGCGSASGGTRTATAPTQAATTGPPATTSVAATTTRRSRLASACSSRARRVLARYGSVHASPFTASSGAESCHFESSGGGPGVVVELDSAPQPYVRMEREQVEFWQNPPYAPLGMYELPTAFHSYLQDVRDGWPQFYGVKKAI